MSILRKILKIILAAILLVGAVFIFSWAKENQKVVLEKFQKAISAPLATQQVSEKSIPVESGAREIVFAWQYNGKNYELKETLFESSYTFYQKSPKAYKYQGELASNWENEYYAMFFMLAKGDNSIEKIANDLKELGEKNKLSEDQIVEMILAFVQKLTYDDSKANIILAGGKETINYPYETLFEQRGVCSDKSILAASILRQLGYGTALFTYEAEKHMALGIKCPQEYSNNGSGYCYAETTSVGFRVGMIPDFDQNNRVMANKEMQFFDQTQMEQFNVKRLGTAKVFQKTEGKIYNGITKTLAVAREIDGLKVSIQNLSKEISSLRSRIESQQRDLENLMSKMKRLKKDGNYDEYNDLVEKYNNMAEDYQDNVKKYNGMIGTYNQKVSRYNSLIKGF